MSAPLLRRLASVGDLDCIGPLSEASRPPADLRREARAAHAECVHRAQSMLEQVFAIAEKSSVKDSVPADWA